VSFSDFWGSDFWGSDLAAFHFLRPYWLVAIPIAVVLAMLATARATARSRWEDVVDPALADAMLDRPAGSVARAARWLAAAALAFASFALAGPSWQRLPQPVQQRTDALVVVLDLSLSMYATDLEPSRLVRARLKIADLLRQRREGYTALVVYAGDAHVVVPLTDDVGTLENLLPALAPAMMPVLGSNPGQAIDFAKSLLATAGAGPARILLVTDGIARLDDLSGNCAGGPPVSILGVGTAVGAPIPLDFVEQPGRFLTERSGERVIARLDARLLDSAASACGGRYRTMSIGDDDLAEVLAPAHAFAPESVTDRRFDVWADAGQYLTLALLPLALLGFRRGVLVAFLVTVAMPVHAGLWDDLWQRRDQQALGALERGDAARAAELFEAPDWQGVARYRGGAYADAERLFTQDRTANGQYNAGNALAREGRLADAIAAYDRALAANPDDGDARFNRALLKSLLEQQQKRGQANQQSPERADANRQSDSGRGQREPSQSDREAAERGRDGRDAAKQNEPSDSAEREDGAARDGNRDLEAERNETRDAVDQWLRRVPDDNGGLLRRKFQYETRERMRHGGYPTGNEEPW
jgi:Ca-activated chloride channel homolog